MNIQTLKEKGWIVYEVISGSHAYGTNVEGSDVDIRGVFIMPTEEMLGGLYFPQISDDNNDIVYYEIGRFIELLADGNPNMLELLNTPSDCIKICKPEFTKHFTEDVKKKFITKKLRHTFTGYAYSQIKKAQGLNKMMNWEEQKVTRKDVLDFCYVQYGNREGAVKFKQIFDSNDLDSLGLAAVNNFPDTYSLYRLKKGTGGIISEDSNEVQLRSIPKEATFISYLRFDRNAYSTHCKDFRQYQEWLEKRNTQRYVDIENHQQKIDGKNMLHTVRLLNMSVDISEGRGIVVRRPEAEYLKDIRKGVYDLTSILGSAEGMIEKINSNFDNCDIPHGVDTDFRRDLLSAIRKDSLIASGWGKEPIWLDDKTINFIRGSASNAEARRYFFTQKFLI
jgi:predicted nucleotidyltransferase